MNTQTQTSTKRWIEVVAPKPWRAGCVGDILEGEYAGSGIGTARNGERFDIHYINNEMGSWQLTGRQASRLLGAAGVSVGDKVKLIYTGEVATGPYMMKDYRLYVLR
jgi:hypothetical protein